MFYNSVFLFIYLFIIYYFCFFLFFISLILKIYQLFNFILNRSSGELHNPVIAEPLVSAF